MKFESIVGFGDSWMWGDELLDPALAHRSDAHPILIENTPYRERHCFLGELGARYNVPVVNFGIPGGSLLSSIWTMLWWLEHEPKPESCLVLVGHTQGSRTSFYNPTHIKYANDAEWNKFVHSAWVHSNNAVNSSDWETMVKMFMVLSECDEWAQLNYQQALIQFDWLSSRRNIPLLQFDISPQSCSVNVPTKVFPGFDLSTWLSTHPDKRQLRCENRHPNEFGHKLIADMLHKKINDVIINSHEHT